MSGLKLPIKGDQEPLIVYQMRVLKKVKTMGGKTTRALKRILNEGEKLDRRELVIFKKSLVGWESYLIENYNHLGELNEWPVGPDGKEVYHSIAMSIYWEISRMRVLIHKEDFSDLVEWKLSNHQHLMEHLGKAGRIVKEDIGVMMFTQDEIKATIFNLVEVIDMIPYTDHLREFVDIVDLKCSTFLCQTMSGTIVNDERFRTVQDMRPGAKPILRKVVTENESGEFEENMVKEWEEKDKRCLFNRDFWIFCTIYVTKLRRRFYYQSMIPEMKLERPTSSYITKEAVERVKSWCFDLAMGLADNFDDIYKSNCRQGYNFDGDKQWYYYKYPMASKTLEAQVRKLRPDIGVHFFEESNVSRRSAINMTNQSYSSRLFVIDLIDRYFRIYKNINWKDGYVIFNSDIEDSFEKLTTSKEPFLIQMFSSFWIYLGGEVLVVDSIYSGICLWLLCIRKSRRIAGQSPDTLFGNCNISELIDKILIGRKKEEPGVLSVKL